MEHFTALSAGSAVVCKPERQRLGEEAGSSMAVQSTSGLTSISDSLISKPLRPYAYVTLLCDGSDYWKGAAALVKSLQLVRSRYPLVVACRKEVPARLRRILASYGCLIRNIEVNLR